MTPADFASAKELKAWFKTLDAASKKEHGRAFNERMAAIESNTPEKPRTPPRVSAACPNCDWPSSTTRGTYLGFLQTICDNCHMAGPKAKLIEDAMRFWNKLPRRNPSG